MMNAAQIKHRGGPAFPVSKEVEAFGMSLEDYFAGQAMATLLIGDPPAKALSAERPPAREIAKQAYALRDFWNRTRTLGTTGTFGAKPTRAPSGMSSSLRRRA